MERACEIFQISRVIFPIFYMTGSRYHDYFYIRSRKRSIQGDPLHKKDPASLGVIKKNNALFPGTEQRIKEI